MNGRKWQILADSKKGKGRLKTDDIADILLENRGIKTAKERKEFFEPTQPQQIKLTAVGIDEKEIKKALKRLKVAKEKKEKIVVYGDYDADGICASAILWETLYSLGFDVLPYIPERFSEGYGLNAQSIKSLKEKDPGLGLVITVDNGIVATKQIEYANSLGIDVVVTDHHIPDKKLPQAYAIVHTTQISGAAIAWFFAREVITFFKGKKDPDSTLELAAIGTVSDQMPLVGVNRSLVKHGLAKLAKTARPGLSSLFEESGVDRTKIGIYEINYVIAPRINAMGRLKHGIDSLRLLCTKDMAKAGELAREIGSTNKERQKIVDEVIIHARNSVVDDGPGIIVLASETYHEGVIGLAAAKLVEEFYRPAIVFSKGEKYSKASARSIAGFDIMNVLREVNDFWTEGGGHAMAAGFTVETLRIEEFAKRINEVAKAFFSDELFTRKLKVDLEIAFDNIDWELAGKLALFEPTGTGNPAPTFVTYGVEVIGIRPVGADGKHLKLKLKKGKVFDAIAFGMGSIAQEISNKFADVAYLVEVNKWNGTRSIELKIRDLKVGS